METIIGYDPVPVEKHNCRMGGDHTLVLVGEYENIISGKEYQILACSKCDGLSIAWRFVEKST